MKKRVPISDVRVGMYVTDENNDWIPHNARNRRGLIRKEETIERMRQLGVTAIYIDTSKGLDAPHGEPEPLVDQHNETLLQGAAEAPPVTRNAVGVAEEMEKATRIHEEAQGLVGQLLGSVKLGEPLTLSPVNDLADELLDSVFRNHNALACLGKIREKDNYLLEHSVNLSVLMSIFGKSVKLSRQAMHDTVVGALLHDLGKILTPDEVLHKPGRLTPEEFEVMKLHASHTRDILLSTPDIGQIALLTASQHHEKMNGSGYPDGLKGEAISIYGRMVAITDVYDAITSDRVYHKGMTPTQGLKKLLEWSGDHLDPKLVRYFIRCIGLYPVGSMVLMESGRLAVVIETNEHDQRLPVVRVMYHTKFRQPIPIKTIDLAQPGVQDRILRAVDPDDYGLDVRPLLA
ncbi:MAG: HD-GYP domain-containing protein [Marinobacter sp.]|nr:HD-GYP domain-containing protein [Marinobacter sp.]